MNYTDAVQAVREIMADLPTHDPDMALNQALQYINKVASGDTDAHPLLVVEAYAISMALARGEDEEEGIAWEQTQRTQRTQKH